MIMNVAVYVPTIVKRDYARVLLLKSALFRILVYRKRTARE